MGFLDAEADHSGSLCSGKPSCRSALAVVGVEAMTCGGCRLDSRLFVGVVHFRLLGASSMCVGGFVWVVDATGQVNDGSVDK